MTSDAASIQTDNPDRDAHLCSADFFDVQRHPTMTFRSTSALQASDGHLVVTGDLTIKDITRQVSLEFAFLGSATDPYGQLRLGFSGYGAINRSDWALTWNVVLEAGGFVLDDRIVLELDVSAVAAA